MNLKALRVAARISQEEAAKQLGVTRQSLYNWESGKAFPGVEYIIAMTDMYNCNPSDMMDALRDINQLRQEVKK